MPGSIVLWIGAAVLFFWAVGAYNRLMRLRAAVKTAFVLLETELTRHVELVRKQLPPDIEHADALDGVGSFWAELQGAAAQLAAALVAVRAHPLQETGLAALNAALGVLEMAWERTEREDAYDLAGPRMPDDVTARHMQLSVQTHAAIEQFNTAAARYNESIVQFPAVMLAVAFGFKAVRTMGKAAPAVQSSQMT